MALDSLLNPPADYANDAGFFISSAYICVICGRHFFFPFLDGLAENSVEKLILLVRTISRTGLAFPILLNKQNHPQNICRHKKTKPCVKMIWFIIEIKMTSFY
ncbi:hypothetical protein ASF92_17380 [Pedobacter sp. Leaf176]|nr:hypothetical protein ASF92_17380 [Pedobacter sp. Leaf176]